MTSQELITICECGADVYTPFCSQCGKEGIPDPGATLLKKIQTHIEVLNKQLARWQDRGVERIIKNKRRNLKKWEQWEEFVLDAIRSKCEANKKSSSRCCS